MAGSRIAGLILGAWEDLDRALAGLSPEEAVARPDGGSSFAWTAAHLANQLDIWINVRIRGAAPHPYISRDEFRFGGSGAAEDWEAVRRGVAEVRAGVRPSLEGLTDADVEQRWPYTGTMATLQGREIPLAYYLLRIAAHHYFHIGEIASKRDRLGHQVGDYPGLLEPCL